MANQITIDIGAAANDGTGDPLRTAFNYVNNNFSNVWLTGLPTSNVQFLDNKILTVNTNANLVLAPNGIGKVASNVDIVPNTANVFALGGPTRRWNTVYGQYLDLSHNAVIGGNLVVTGNLSAGNISYTSNVFVGDLEGSVFDGASSVVLDVIDSAIYVDNYRYANGVPVTFGGVAGGANTQIQFNDDGSFGGQAGFAFIKTTGNLTVPGNIINNTNSTANLGSPLYHWNYLYTSNVSASNNISASGNIVASGNISTTRDIFANNASVSNITSSNSIYSVVGTFTGEDETGNDSLYIGHPTFTVLGTDIMAQFTGNVTNYGQINFQNYSNSVTASGDYIITADNGNDSTHYIDMGMTSSTWDGSQTNVLDGLTTNNGYLYVQDGNLTLGTRNDNTSYTWNFDTTGNLTLPVDGNLNINAGEIVQAPDNNLIIRVQDADNDDYSLDLVVDDGAENQLTRVLLDRGGIEFSTDMQGVGHSWRFDDNGEFDLAGNIYGVYGGSTSLYAVDDGANGSVELKTISYLGDTLGSNIRVTQSNATISTANATNTWTFDNTGNLVLPNSGVVYETDIPFSGLSGKTIALKPSGGTDADQQLLVYPTAGADFNHLHLTTGNLWNTELFLGNDDFYVKLANTGSIVINTNDNTGNTAQWTFDTQGTILNSGNLTLQTPSGIPNSVANWNGGGGWNQTLYSNLATTGGTGTGLTVDVAAGGSGYISINEITINTPGTGYTNGDVITIDNENNIPGTFTVSVPENAWTFDNTGNLTFPDDTVQTTAWTGILPNPTYSGSDQIGFATPAPLNLNNSAEATLLTQLNLLNTGGGAGSGSAIDFWTYTSINDVPEVRLQAVDDGAYSADFAIKLKATGNEGLGSLTTSWTFGSDGALTFPDNSNIVDGGFNGTASSTVSLNAFSPDGNTVSFQAQGNTSNAIVQTYANDTATTNTWTFDNTGNLTLPADGYLRVTSGIVGTGASPAPSLSGFSTVSAVTANISGNITANIVASTNNDSTGRNIKVGDDTWLGDINISNTLSIRGQQDAANAYIVFGNASNVALGRAGNGPLTYGGDFSVAGNVTGNTAGYAIGYRDIPQVSFAGDTTIATTDAGKHYYSTESTDYTLTIANNASQGFQVGAAITVVNQGTGNITIAQGSGVTLYMAGNASSGNRSVATFGMATIMKVATDTWFVSGVGVA